MKNVEVSENSPLSTGLGEGLSNGLGVGPKGNWSSLSIADTVQLNTTPSAGVQNPGSGKANRVPTC